MPAINYDLPDVLFTKDRNDFLFTVTDENLDAVDLTGGTAALALTSHAGIRVVYKSGVDVLDQVANTGQILITLGPSDTIGLAGRYMYECVVTIAGTASTVAYGEVTFRTSRVG